jgi:hypothetical protein
MRRLCTDSSCSYSGRSAWRAAGIGHGSRTEGHVERHGVTTGPYSLFLTARPAVTQGVTGQKSADWLTTLDSWREK